MSKSKGIRLKQKQRAKKIIKLRDEGKSWKAVAILVKMDKNNTRRTYLKFQQSKGDKLA